MTEKQALIVGLTVLDVVNFCADFPKEDEDVKILSQSWVKGGNAANTACVLAQNKKINVELLTCLSGKTEQKFIIDQIKNCNVNVANAVIYADVLFPSSNCIVNMKNGSRTILHYRENFPEIPLQHFDNLDLMKYNWIHFEGRNSQAINAVISKIKRFRKTNEKFDILRAKPLLSAEMEKPKRMNELFEYLAPIVDVLFISKDIGMALQCGSPEECVAEIRSRFRNPDLIVCAWGEKGVCASMRREDENFINISVKAEKVNVVDSLGAGDTFIAGVISHLMGGHTVEESITYANSVAAKKCGQIGYDNLL